MDKSKQTENEDSWYSDIQRAVQNVYYISESEAPLTLQQAPPIEDLNALQRFIAENSGVDSGKQQLIHADDFLNEIYRSTDPSDPIIQLNTERLADLFSMLKRQGRILHIVRVKGAPSLIYIAAVGNSGSAVIRTEVVET